MTPLCRPLVVGALVGLTVAVLVVGGCADTRFVLVEATTTTVAAGAVSAPPTTAATLDEDDLAAIEETLGEVFAIDDRPFDERAPFLTGADDLGPTYTAVYDVVGRFDVQTEIVDVAAAGDGAVATVDVLLDGAPYQSSLPVELTRGTSPTGWQVTRGGACTILSLASPCPDAPVEGDG